MSAVFPREFAWASVCVPPVVSRRCLQWPSPSGRASILSPMFISLYFSLCVCPVDFWYLYSSDFGTIMDCMLSVSKNLPPEKKGQKPLVFRIISSQLFPVERFERQYLILVVVHRTMVDPRGVTVTICSTQKVLIS